MYFEGKSATVTEKIMMQILSHLIPDEKDHPEHYNRTYEIIIKEIRSAYPDKK